MTTIIKVQNAPSGWKDDPNYVYIGRANGRAKLKQSKWHNPFKAESKTTGAHHRCIEQFREYIMSRPDLLGDLHELSEKTLVCWCKPELPCHGDVLVELLEAAKRGGTT